MNIGIKITATLIGAQVVMAAAFGLAMPAHAKASPINQWPMVPDASMTTTVDGTDYPVCAEEDCSDQPGQVGVWFNDGRAWLILGEDGGSRLITP